MQPIRRQQPVPTPVTSIVPAGPTARRREGGVGAEPAAATEKAQSAGAADPDGVDIRGADTGGSPRRPGHRPSAPWIAQLIGQCLEPPAHPRMKAAAEAAAAYAVRRNGRTSSAVGLLA